MHRIVRTLLLAAALLTPVSCGMSPSATAPMPAARAALPAEYRIFYDALEEDGDWTLIEPYGYVFRPDVNFVAWHPYENGFWVASDLYGWVWISTESFGWATYHYGRWLYDDYQGWVWVPGVDWGPAWVSWQTANQYVGWAPLAPGPNAAVPNDAIRWAPMAALGSTDVSTRMVPADQLGESLQEARPVRNMVERNGVRFNRGPSIETVERYSGPLQRVKLADSDPNARSGAGSDPAARIDAMRRAGDDAARQAQQIAKTGGPPPVRVPVLRPVLPKPSGDGRTPTRGPAAPDTTHH